MIKHSFLRLGLFVVLASPAFGAGIGKVYTSSPSVEAGPKEHHQEIMDHLLEIKERLSVIEKSLQSQKEKIPENPLSKSKRDN